MKFFLTAILFFIFFTEDGTAQLSDSLYTILPAAVRPADRHALTAKEKQFILQRAGYDIPRKYYKEVNEIANAVILETKSTNDRELRINNFLALGNYFYVLTKGDSAFYYYKKLIEAIDGKGDHNDLLIIGYKDIGSIYSYGNKKDSAISYVHLALDIARAQNDSAAIYSCYDLYCSIYYDLQLYEKAIFYNNQFLTFLAKTELWGINYTAAYLLNANCYIRLYEKNRDAKYTDSARQVIATALAATKKDSLDWRGSCNFFTGRLLYSENKFAKALNYFDSSLQDKYRLSDKYFRTPRPKYFFKALCLIRTGNYAAGKRILDSIQVDDFSDYRLLNQALYEYAQSIGDWKAAYNYHKEFIRYSDSMNVVGLNGFVFEAEQKYSVVEKQAAITALENENLLQEKERNRLIFFSVLGILIMLIVIILLFGMFRRSQLRRTSERQQLTGDLYKMEADMNDERAVQQLVQQSMIVNQRKKISENIHDEIMSGMAALRYRISYNKSKSGNDNVKTMLSGMEEDALALYMQAKDFLVNLNRETPPEVRPNNVVSLLKNLSERFYDEKLLQIIYNCDEARITKSFTAKIHHELYLIIKEAVANIIKHANAHKVVISILFESDDCVVAISDNGKGFDREKITAGLGLQSIEKRVVSLNGIVQFSSDNRGTLLKIVFPVSS